MTASSPGRRVTRQRAAVAAALADVDEFRSAQELHELLTTVYRTLQSLADEGAVDVLRTADGESAYRRCTDSHHHHLVCRSCGRTVEVEGPQVERWADQVATAHGFAEVSHTIEIFGRCRDCTNP